MEDSNLEIEIKLLKKDFEYLKKDFEFLKEQLLKINNKLDDEGRIHRIINKKFDEDMLAFKNKYYNLFYVILVTAVAFSFTIYKTFIK
jgi:predicted RNase H-like nuclease (RuvC/YqgF family)